MTRFVRRSTPCYHPAGFNWVPLAVAGGVIMAAVYVWDRYHVAIEEILLTAVIVTAVGAAAFASYLAVRFLRLTSRVTAAQRAGTASVPAPAPLSREAAAVLGALPPVRPAAPLEGAPGYDPVYDAVGEVAAKVRERRNYERVRDLKDAEAGEHEAVVYVLRPDGVERKDAP